ncbi:MAG: hypothetical protein IT260_18975 [Saprospiraceae bacterium]|nr:hypothetical protein [Saprospiraceae bacterium]
MNTAEQRFDQIEQYLRGLLSREEAAAFEATMAADPDLAALVQQHRLERQGLELLVERDLLAQMRAWDRESAQQAPATATRRAILRPITVLWRVAAVLSLALLGWWLLRDQSLSSPEAIPTVVDTKPEIRSKAPSVRKPAPARPKTSSPSTTPAPDTDEEPSDDIAEQPSPAAAPETQPSLAPSGPDYAALGDEFYRDRDFQPAQVGKGDAGNSSYNQALDSYKNGKFGDAITKLRPQLNAGPETIQRKELMAHSLYKSGQFDAAIPYFREIMSSGQSPYAERAEWALALSLLQQMPAKKPLFDRVLAGILANPRHAFYRQAQSLQNRLQ